MLDDRVGMEDEFGSQEGILTMDCVVLLQRPAAVLPLVGKTTCTTLTLRSKIRTVVVGFCRWTNTDCVQ